MPVDTKELMDSLIREHVNILKNKPNTGVCGNTLT